MKRLLLCLAGLAYGAGAPAASPAPAAPPAHVDHVILGIRDLDAGMRQFEERTGVRPKLGGEHPGRGTRNALVSLGPDVYLEILAPQAGAPESPGDGGLHTKAELAPVGWAVFVRDLDATRGRLRAAGFGLSDVAPGSRTRPDGTRLEWKAFDITQPELAAVPFFIRWGDGTTHPSQDSPAGCRLVRLRIATRDADAVRRLFAALPLDVAVAAGAHDAMEVTLQCPKGTVEFRGDVSPR